MAPYKSPPNLGVAIASYFHHGVFCEEFPNHPNVFEVLKSLETLEPPEAFDPGLHPGNFTKTWILLVPLLVLKLGNKETKNDYACLFFQHLAKHGNSGVFLKRLNYMTQGPKQYTIQWKSFKFYHIYFSIKL